MQEKGNLIEDLMPGYRAERSGRVIRLVDAEGHQVARSLDDGGSEESRAGSSKNFARRS